MCDVSIQFYKMIITQFRKQIWVLRSDKGKEYINHKMKIFFLDHGLLHQASCPNTPQQNGIAEQKHRTLLNMAHSIMIESFIPKSFGLRQLAQLITLQTDFPQKASTISTP